MRSTVVRSPKSLVLEERRVSEPGPGEVRINVHACGVCHSDHFVTDVLWPGLQLPRVPGHEVAGVVDALGEGVDRFQVGDRVGVARHGGYPGACDACLTGRFIRRRNQKITGISFDSGYGGGLDAGVCAAVAESCGAIGKPPDCGAAGVAREGVYACRSRRVQVRLPL